MVGYTSSSIKESFAENGWVWFPKSDTKSPGGTEDLAFSRCSTVARVMGPNASSAKNLAKTSNFESEGVTTYGLGERAKEDFWEGFFCSGLSGFGAGEVPGV